MTDRNLIISFTAVCYVIDAVVKLLNKVSPIIAGATVNLLN